MSTCAQATSGIRKSVTSAAIVAAGLMIASGAGYRYVGWCLSRPFDSSPISSEALANLPMRIGDWHGREEKLDEAVVRATNADAHINRIYRRGTESVALFIAYGVRTRDLMPHRPEVCYPGAGWVLKDSVAEELRLAGESELPCKVYRFDHGGLSGDSVTVLDYYIVDGQYCPDVSLLRSRALRGSGGVRYVAQVQITCSRKGYLPNSAAGRSVRDFASVCAPEIYVLMASSSQAARQITGQRPTERKERVGD